MGIMEIGREVVDWIYSAQDRDQWRDMKMVMDLSVP
jgi:hypothetical protein